jgi:hypothetical protein
MHGLIRLIGSFVLFFYIFLLLLARVVWDCNTKLWRHGHSLIWFFLGMYLLIDRLAAEELHLGIGAACMAMDSVCVLFFFMWLELGTRARSDKLTHGWLLLHAWAFECQS